MFETVFQITRNFEHCIIVKELGRQRVPPYIQYYFSSNPRIFRAMVHAAMSYPTWIIQGWLWNLWATIVVLIIFTKLMDALFNSYAIPGTKIPKNDATITRKKTTQLLSKDLK